MLHASESVLNLMSLKAAAAAEALSKSEEEYKKNSESTFKFHQNKSNIDWGKFDNWFLIHVECIQMRFKITLVTE